MNDFKLSSRKRRLLAFFIDYIVILLPFVLIMFFLWNIITKEMIVGLTIGLLMLFCLFAKDTFKGISFGKWVMGIKVVDKNDISEISSFWRLFIRNIFIAIWVVEFFAWLNKSKQRLGDKVAKTLVIKNINSSSIIKRILILVFVLTSAFGLAMLGGTSMIKKSEPYKVAIEQIMQDKNIQDEVGGIKEFGYFPTGNIRITNGVGSAMLQIKIIGNNKTKTISVSLYKERNKEDWQIFGYNLVNKNE